MCEQNRPLVRSPLLKRAPFRPALVGSSPLAHRQGGLDVRGEEHCLFSLNRSPEHEVGVSIFEMATDSSDDCLKQQGGSVFEMASDSSGESLK
jgi:hypothetical protein